jgi:hypothetical protein
MAAAPASAAVSAGERFVMSDGYKAVKDAAARGRTWWTGEIDVGLPGVGYQSRARCSRAQATPLRHRRRLGSGDAGCPGRGAEAVSAPGVQSLLMGALAETSTIRCATESTATSAAAGVAEGG